MAKENPDLRPGQGNEPAQTVHRRDQHSGLFFPTLLALGTGNERKLKWFDLGTLFQRDGLNEDLH